MVDDASRAPRRHSDGRAAERPTRAHDARCADGGAAERRVQGVAGQERGRGRSSAAALLCAVPLLAVMLSGCSLSWPWGEEEEVASRGTLGAPTPAAAPPANSVNSIVAVVDGEPITVGDLRRYKRTDGPFLPEELRNDNRALLQSMIERRLLKAEFEKNGIRVEDAIVDSYIQGIMKDSGQSRAEIESALNRVGLTWADYFERMREEVQRVALINMLIRSRVNVPDEEVEDAWKNDPAFMQNEKLVIADIYVPLPSDDTEAASVRAQIPEIHKQAKKDFEDAAKKYSKGPGASDGGKLGEFQRGTLADYFEKALKDLDEGDVSEPIEGGGGVHIVKLLDVKASGRRPLEEVKDEIRDKLYQRRLEERYRKWASEDLRREHRVEILQPDLSGIPG